MSRAVKLSNELVESAKIHAAAAQRPSAQQIEYWARLGKAVEENSELPLQFIKDTLLALEDVYVVLKVNIWHDLLFGCKGHAMVAEVLRGLVAAAQEFVTIRGAVITLAIVTAAHLRKHIWSAMLRAWPNVRRIWHVVLDHMLRSPRFYTIAIPLALILGMFAKFYHVVTNGYVIGTGTLADRGTFGDSFGVITSLFTGLGFAGLTITLVIQQWQISRQKQDSENARDDQNFARYDSTLHQLLDLYKQSVDCVVIKRDETTFEGLEGIGHANNKLLNTLKKSKAAILPSDVARRYGKGETTDNDWRTLDHLFNHNTAIIESTFIRQGRIINSFTLLMHHLEDRPPPRFKDIQYARALVHSQLTTLEVSYFFYLALGFKKEDNLRRLLRSSGLLEAFPTVCHLEIHRVMYMQLWGYDPRTGLAPRKPTSSKKPVAESSDWEIVEDDGSGQNLP